jgi:hypothetical protein
MELFGILIVAMLGVVASPIYCLIVEKVVRRINLLSHVLWWISSMITALFITEIFLVLIFGPVELRRFVGRWFFCIHSISFLSIAPALGALLLLVKKKGKLITWYFVAPICWITGIAAILYQFFVAESLYGVDGSGGPYIWPW